jgi:hypothetical protein
MGDSVSVPNIPSEMETETSMKWKTATVTLVLALVAETVLLGGYCHHLSWKVGMYEQYLGIPRPPLMTSLRHWYWPKPRVMVRSGPHTYCIEDVQYGPIEQPVKPVERIDPNRPGPWRTPGK